MYKNFTDHDNSPLFFQQPHLQKKSLYLWSRVVSAYHELVLYIKVAWRQSSVFPTSQRERALAKFIKLKGLSQLRQRTESTGRLSTFEERIYSVIKSIFETEHLDFLLDVEAQTQRPPTLQNITITGVMFVEIIKKSFENDSFKTSLFTLG